MQGRSVETISMVFQFYKGFLRGYYKGEKYGLDIYKRVRGKQFLCVNWNHKGTQ